MSDIQQPKARKWYGSKWITPHKRLAIYLRDNFTCLYCGLNLAEVKASQRTLDHVIPVNDGGDNQAHNLVTCCKPCNDSKQDRSAWLFVQQDPYKFTRIKEQTMKLLNISLAKQILAGTLDLSDCIDAE